MNEILNLLHDFYGHPGISKFYRTVKNRICGNSLKKKIVEVVSNCIDCHRNKKFVNKSGELKGFLLSNTPGEIICSDIVGPYDADYFEETGKFYALTFIDVFTRNTKIYKIKKIDGLTVAKKLEHMINNTPYKIKKLLTDQGTQYRSHAVKEICKRNEIIQTFTCPFTPTSNAIAERINSTINTVLRIYKNRLSSKDALKKAEFRLNNTFNRSLSEIPSEILSRESELAIDEVEKKNLKELYSKMKEEKEKRLAKE
jgi:hypothetical protein